MAIQLTSASAEALRINNYSASIPTNQMTVALWVWADSLPTWGSLVKNWGFPSGGFIHLGLQDGTGKISVFVQEEDTTQLGPIIDPINLATGQWVHIMVTADGSNIRLYTDGTEVGTAVAYDGTLQTNSAPALGIGRKPNDAGNGFAATNNGDPWNGRIAELGIWNVGLGAGERTALAVGYSPGAIRSNSRIDYWKFINIDTASNSIDSHRSLVQFNTPTNASHPPMIYPHRQRVVAPPVAAAVGTGYARLINFGLVRAA